MEAELLSAGRTKDRFGVSVPSDLPVLHQPDAGVILADRAREVLLDSARAGRAPSCSSGSASGRRGAGRIADRRDRPPPLALRFGDRHGKAVDGGTPRRVDIELPIEVVLVPVRRLPDRARSGQSTSGGDGLSGRRAVCVLGSRARPQGGPARQGSTRAIGRGTAPGRRRGDRHRHRVGEGALSRRALARGPVESCLYNQHAGRTVLPRTQRTHRRGFVCNGQGFQFATERASSSRGWHEHHRPPGSTSASLYGRVPCTSRAVRPRSSR